MSKDDENRPTEVVGLDARLAKAVPEEPAVVGFLLAGDGLQPGRVFPLTRNSTLIGRADNADIRLAHAAISGEHARITTVGLGFEIEDLGSVNGTFVNGQRITRGKLNRGDRLVLGSLDFTFLVEKTRDSKAALLAPNQRRTALLTNLRPQGAVRTATDDDDSMSFGDMVRSTVGAWNFIRAHLRLLLSLAVVFAGIGAASAFILPAPSTATAVARLDTKKKVNPLNPDTRTQDLEAEFFIDPERSFLAPPLVLETLQKVGKPTTDEDVALQVMERLDIKPDGERIFKATFKKALLPSSSEPDPVLFLDAHLKNYIDSDIARGLKKLESETKYLDDTLATTVTELQKINAELGAFKEAHADDLPEYASSAQSSRLTLETRRTEISAELTRLRAELRAEESHGEEDTEIKAKSDDAADARTSLLKAKRELAEAHGKGLADGHPEVIAIKEKITKLEGLINELTERGVDNSLKSGGELGNSQRRTRRSTLERQISGLSLELRETERNLEQVKKTVRSSPVVGAGLERLQTQYDAKKRLHDQLSDKAHRATMQLNVERLSAQSRFDIISSARLSKPALGKTLGMRIGIGIGLAVALTALIMALREARKHVHPPQSSSSSSLVPRL